MAPSSGWTHFTTRPQQAQWRRSHRRSLQKTKPEKKVMISKILKKFGYECDAEDGKGAFDPKRIPEFEQILGKPLPADYREFLLKYAPGGFNKDVQFRPLEP